VTTEGIETQSGRLAMRNQHETEGGATARRARILWRDEDTGEVLWLVLTGTNEFFEELERVGYDLRPLPDAPRGAPVRTAGHAA
jgi:hypothetical protein